MPAEGAEPEPAAPFLYATYSYDSELEPSGAARLLAAEQSSGHGAQAAGGAISGDVVIAAASESEITLGYGPRLISSIPSLLVLLQGEALELEAFKSLRLSRIEVSPGMADLFPGPRFGVAGIREILGVFGRPLAAAILKPSVGLSPDGAADLAAEYVLGGADVIKDDELASASYSELAARCRAVASSVALGSSQRGRPAAYALNITGPVDELEARIALCNAFDNVWPMVCEYAVGLDALRILRKESLRPILCHRAGVGATIRSEKFGMSQEVQVTLSRLCGADLVHCGSFRGKLFDRDQEVKGAISAASRPIRTEFDTSLVTSMPLIGGGFGAEEAKYARSFLETDDLCIVFGASVAFADEGPREAMAKIVSTMGAGSDAK